MGFQKYYVIIWVGHGRCLRLLTRWVGGVKKGQKYADVIFEWSLTYHLQNVLKIFCLFLLLSIGFCHDSQDKSLNPLSICTWFLQILQFEISSLMNLIFSLFQTWILQTTAEKFSSNQEKIQSNKLDNSNWRIAKIKCR